MKKIILTLFAAMMCSTMNAQESDSTAVSNTRKKVGVVLSGGGAKGYNAASFSLAAIDTLVHRGEEEAMRHWDEIVAQKQRIGIDESFRPTILQPLRPQVLTEKRRVTGFTFENMTAQDERFIRQKHHLDKLDSIDAKLQQQLTTTMRVDLFYQTAECRLVQDGDDLRAILSASGKKSAQLHAGVRFDTEESNIN